MAKHTNAVPCSASGLFIQPSFLTSGSSGILYKERPFSQWNIFFSSSASSASFLHFTLSYNLSILRRSLYINFHKLSFNNFQVLQLYNQPTNQPTTFKMQYTSSILLLAFAATNVLAHGVVTEVQGANGVNMPALSGKLSHLLLIASSSFLASSH